MIDWLLEHRYFMPHGHCYLWRPDILWMHVLSNALIALAYFSIPATLMYFIRKRGDVPFKGVIAMFAAFIVLCGLTHVMGVVTIWNPLYTADGVLKSITAVVSVATAVMLVPFIPVALSMRSPTELAALNARLEEELEARQLSEARLKKSVDALSMANAALAAARADVDRLNAELEARVRTRTAQLEASNKDLEGFAYSVSHDLRAPLRAIDNFSAFLAEDHAAQLDEGGLRLLGKVRGNAARMGQLIDAILAFARAGKQDLAPDRVDMAALARTVFEEVREDAGVDAELRMGEIPAAHGDRTMLRQVWVNLLSNAVKFGAAHAPVVGEVEASEGAAATAYTARDFGGGFDPAYAHKLFGVFQRLHAMDEFEGTGVGLAIVKRIIDKHGGRIWAEGAPGAGAAFHFSIPHEVR